MAILLAKIYVWLAPYVLWLVLIVAGSTAIWGCVMRWERNTARHQVQEVKNAWTLDTAQRTQVALAAETKALAKEKADADKLKEVQDAYSALQASHADALARQRVALADNGRLRHAIAAYAAGGGASSPDSAAAASERAARLGELLARALRADAEHAAAAESNADGVRALLAAWPHDDDSISLGKLKLGS